MPKIYIIAGPNGIGKTTSVFDLVPVNLPVINSDEIAASVRDSGLTINVQEYGNSEAMKMVSEFLRQKVSFAIESNLADVDTWKFLIDVQNSGYEIHLIYMSTDDLSLLNFRIEQRALGGEHFVRPDIVEERYINGLNLLSHYIQIPDVLHIMDNSESLLQIAEIKKGEIESIRPDLPGWVQKYLMGGLRKQRSKKTSINNLNSKEDIRKLYEALKNKSIGQRRTGK